MSDTELNPAGFDVEEWLQDAAMPEESIDVYKRADVIGELERLKRQIAVQREAAAGAERTASDTNELAELEKRYDDLVETFAGSQLTVYVRAISGDEKRELREASDKRTEGKTPLERNADHGYGLLARAVIAVRPFEGERVTVNWGHEQIRKLENTLGPAQMNAVLQAHQRAQANLPAVDADFLHRPSGEGDGPEL
jgi:hypothetical protein